VRVGDLGGGGSGEGWTRPGSAEGTEIGREMEFQGLFTEGGFFYLCFGFWGVASRAVNERRGVGLWLLVVIEIRN
jgi:hypothetical protein